MFPVIPSENPQLTVLSHGGGQCVICSGPVPPSLPRGQVRKLCANPVCTVAYARAHTAESKTKRRAKLIASEGSVTCRICGRSFLRISHSHLHKHGITPGNYARRFPEAPVVNERLSHELGHGARQRAGYLSYAGCEPDEHLFEYVVGALLGDGSLTAGKQARYSDGGSNELYLKWKAELLGAYFKTHCWDRLAKPHKLTGKRYLGWWLKTGVHPLFTEWREAWYPTGVKQVSAPLAERWLSAFGLAVWFCDDGHVSKSHACLYTMGFRPDEASYLSELVAHRFHLPSTVLFNKKQQPFLRFGAAYVEPITTLLQQFSIPGMAYKAFPLGAQP